MSTSTIKLLFCSGSAGLYTHSCLHSIHTLCIKSGLGLLLLSEAVLRWAAATSQSQVPLCGQRDAEDSRMANCLEAILLESESSIHMHRFIAKFLLKSVEFLGAGLIFCGKGSIVSTKA